MRDDAADAGVAGVSVVCLRTRDAAAIGQRHPWRLRYRPTLTALLMALSTPLWAQWVTVDPTFPTGSGPNAFVRTVAVQPNGQILVAGTFTNISGSLRPYIARLGTNGVVDAGFVTQLSAEATRVQPLLGGHILISGSFSNVNGVACPGLARLQADGTLDSSFAPPSGLSTAGSVAGLAASNGVVWVTGAFTSLGGLPRNSVARLLPNGAVDPSFQSPFAATNTVALVALQADGKPLISGSFTNLPGASVTNLVRLNLDGSVDASFVARLAPGERVIRGLLMPDGRLVAAVAPYADFGMASAIPHLVRLGLDGSLDPTFNVTFEAPGFPWSSTVYALALQPDGRILVSGTFLRVNGVSRGKLARLAPDGTLDFCFDVAMGGEWTPLTVAPGLDGSVVVGGSFSGLQGQSHPYLLRLLLPPAGCAQGVIEMAVPAVEFREDALRAIIPVVRHGGADLEQSFAFTTRDGSAHAGTDYQATSGTVRFARGDRSQFISIPIYSDGLTEGPETFEVQLTQANDGSVLGALTNVVVTLTDAPAGTAGAPDTNFVVQLDGAVQAILPLADGRVVVAGTFTNVNGQFSPNLTRLRADGTLEWGFLHSKPMDGDVRSVAMDGAGRLLVAGYFQHVDGLWRPGLARFGSDGTLDNTFAPFDAAPTNAYGGVTLEAVTVLADGGIVCSATVPGAGYDSYDVLLKLSASGVVDSAFTNRVPPEVEARPLLAAPDGGFFLFGLGFGSTLSRLHSDGTLNLDFVPPADRQSTYYNGDLNLLPDGRVTVAGLASAYYGLISAGPLWRLNPDGSLDAGFNVSNSVASFGLQSADAISTAPDGRVLVAGAFSTGSSTVWTLRRLNADGSPDWSFDPGSGFTVAPTSGYPSVNALAALPGGSWLAGGEFGSYSGFNQRYLVKVLPETLLQPHTIAFAVTNVSLLETNTVLTFEVRRRGDASVPASVTVFTQDGTATAGADYLPLNTNLTFAAGEWSRTVSVTVLDDAVVEATEQFSLRLTNATGGFSLGQPSTVTISIQNNDAGIEFIQDQFSAVEEDGFAMVVVRWSGALSNNLQAQVRIVPITGSSNDLGVSSLWVRYGTGTSYSTNALCIPVNDDAQHESTRQFRLELSGSSNLSIGPRSNALLVLNDGDFTTTPARGVAGVVEAIANAPAGGVYLAGDFSSVHGVPRSRVARLLPDGELDASFTPREGPDADVTAVAVQADGKVLIAGAFANVAGTPRAGLARLNADGSVDSSFDPGLGVLNTNGPAFVRVLLPQGDGSVWVGGEFTHVNNRYGRHLAKLLTNGVVDTTFTSPFRAPTLVPWPGRIIDASALYSLVKQPDGQLVAGGTFYISVGNYISAQVSVVRFSQAGLVDSSSTNTMRTIDVAYSLAMTAEGKILVGGAYTTNWLAVWRLGTNGTTDTTFRIRNAPAVSGYSSEVRQLLVQPDGRILFSAAIFVLGSGDPAKAAGNLDHVIVGRLLADGSWDSSFASLTCALPLLQQTGPYWFNSPTFVRSLGPELIVPSVAMARQGDGVLVMAGAFDSVNGEPRRRLARVDADGSLRGRLLLELSTGAPLRLSLPAEVEFPYVLETSSDLTHWTAWLQDDYPWWPAELWLAPNEPARFFRARPAP
ncbi:MAG: Calx-beta domain-containing protein [Verrucomicrobiota bacterium]